MTSFVIVVVSWAVIALLAYWVIRLAVRHAMRDTDDRRAIEAARTQDAAAAAAEAAQ